METKQKILISLAIFAALLLVLGFFAIYPALSDIQKKSGEIVAKKAAVESLRQRTLNVSEFKSRLPNIQPDLDKIDGLFIDSDTPIDFIEFLERQTENLSAELEIAASPVKKDEPDLWNSMNFHLDLTSSFSNFLRFLESLESGPYLVEIINLNIRRLEKPAGDINSLLLIKVFTKTSIVSN